MKKFIIVIVFGFLIAILISFNYLLWDREKQLESFQDISDSKNLTIETLSEKMNNLDKQNKELNTTVERLEEENTKLKNNEFTLKSENNSLSQKVTQSNSFILTLKKIMDTEPINTVLKTWVDAINAKNYESAQSLISEKSTNTILNDNHKLEETIKKEIKSIKIKSVEPYNGLTDQDHIAKIQFLVVFEVDKQDDTPSELFKSGENLKYFTMEYTSSDNGWKILEMTDKP